MSIRAGRQPARRAPLRWLPLLLFTALLLVYAAYSKQPDHPFQWRPFHLTVDLSPAALAAAATKGAHWVHFGVTCLLAYVALAGRAARVPFALGMAFALTMAIGLVVELEQAFTSRGAKLADLAPDLLGAACAVLLILAVRRLRGGRVRADLD
jgi:VanZ family protein